MDPAYVLLKMEYDDIRACRVCLSVGTKLYDLHETGILDIFAEFTGVPVSQTDGLPQHLCFMCHSLFRKSMVFRNKCRSTQDYLLSVGAQITTSYLKSLDTTHLSIPLNISQIEIIDVPSQPNFINDIKEEITDIVSSFNNGQKDYGDDDDINLVIDDGLNNDALVDYDNDIDDDDEKLINIQNRKAKENNVYVKTEKLERKRAKDKKADDKDRKALKRKLLRYNKDASQETRLFYEFVIDKYVDNVNKAVNLNNVTDILDSDNETRIEDVLNTNVDTDKLDPNKKLFYNYLNDKYIKRIPEVDMKKYKKRKVKRKKKDKRYKDEDDMLAFAKMYNFELQFLSSREEKYAELVVRKQSLKYKKGRYRCEFCFFGFQTENVFKNHMVVHDPSSGSHLCEVCATRFQRGTELLEHQRRHHMYKYTCAECGKCVPYSSLAKQHYEFHKGIKYECEHCGKKYSKYSSRLDHIRIHHATTVCEICYETFQGPLGLRSHNTKIHKNSAVCVGCNKQFESLEAVRRHADTRGACDHTLKPCRKCGYNFTTAELLDEHISQYHTKQKTSESAGYTMKKRVVRKRVIYCKCINMSQLEQYKESNGDEAGMQNIASDGYPLIGDKLTNELDIDARCDTCGHLRKKRKPKKFLCEICADRMFTSEAALKYHQRIHTGERPYQCPMCPKRFRVKENLHNHVNTHTGERPYKCPHCPKAFRTNTANHRHQLVHTKKRPYRCDICDKTFQTSTYLKIHVRTVHMKIPMPPRVRNRKRHVE